MRPFLLGAVLVSSAFADGRPTVEIKTTLSKAKTESSLTVELVSRALQTTYFRHVQRCYRDRFGSKSSAKGNVKLVFGVEPDGKTIGVVVASFDKKLGTCITERVRTWTFPPPKDAANQPIATSFVYELALAPFAAQPSTSEDVRLSEDDVAMVNLLTSSTELDPSNDMSTGRTPGADLAQQIDKARGSGSPPHGPRVPPSTPSSPTGRITFASKSALDSTSLTPDLVLRKIQSAYMVGLKRCYTTQLKTNPSLKGKLKMAFTVEATGRTASVTVSSFDSALDACVKGMIANWRFPSPTASDLVASARFEFALQMVPD